LSQPNSTLPKMKVPKALIKSPQAEMLSPQNP
jgi:hypothetical protein